MQHDLIFIGSQFRNNEIFYDYILRNVKQALQSIDTIKFYDDNDKNLFLTLEPMMQKPSKLVIICSKSNFSVVGRLLCTLTEDIQIVKDDMLIPSRTDVYGDNAYLIKVNEAQVNVLLAEVNKKIPELLFDESSHSVKLHIFEESEDDIKLLLSPLAESLDVTFKSTLLIQGWYVVDVYASKYGELSGFITAATSLWPDKLIATSNIFSYIIDRLDKNGAKVTTAESCTGGLISTLLTKESGSSNVFDGGIVTYSNE
jgi:nicotinamide-nucleotide amidase